jgi:hypothetical protein
MRLQNILKVCYNTAGIVVSLNFVTIILTVTLSVVAFVLIGSYYKFRFTPMTLAWSKLSRMM